MRSAARFAFRRLRVGVGAAGQQVNVIVGAARLARMHSVVVFEHATSSRDHGSFRGLLEMSEPQRGVGLLTPNVGEQAQPIRPHHFADLRFRPACAFHSGS